MSYFPNPQATKGGQNKVITTDWNAEELLREILIELKKLNLQMALITDSEIKESDIT
jgi:hypothetical protein